MEGSVDVMFWTGLGWLVVFGKGFFDVGSVDTMGCLGC